MSFTKQLHGVLFSPDRIDAWEEHKIDPFAKQVSDGYFQNGPFWRHLKHISFVQIQKTEEIKFYHNATGNYSTTTNVVTRYAQQKQLKLEKDCCS